MYNERRDSFSMKDILVQLLFVVVFVFLLIWLFPGKKTVYKAKDTYTGRIFAENIKTMKEAGKSHFVKSKLPAEIGDVKKITLKEMIEEKLIIPFQDGNGNQCEENSSYVELIKVTKDEYSMKTYLSCTDDQDHIVDNMGFYSYCSTTICEKEPDNVNGNNNGSQVVIEDTKPTIERTSDMSQRCALICLVVKGRPPVIIPPKVCDSKVECCDGDTWETNPKWCPKTPEVCDSKVECCDGDTWETNPKWCPKPPVPGKKECEYTKTTPKTCKVWNNWAQPLPYYGQQLTNTIAREEKRAEDKKTAVGNKFIAYDRTKPVYDITYKKLIGTYRQNTCEGYKYYIINNYTFAEPVGTNNRTFVETKQLPYCPEDAGYFEYDCNAISISNCRDCTSRVTWTVNVYKIGRTQIKADGSDTITKRCSKWKTENIPVYGKDARLIGYEPIWETAYVYTPQYTFRSCTQYAGGGTQSTWGVPNDSALINQGYKETNNCRTK